MAGILFEECLVCENLIVDRVANRFDLCIECSAWIEVELSENGGEVEV